MMARRIPKAGATNVAWIKKYRYERLL